MVPAAAVGDLSRRIVERRQHRLRRSPVAPMQAVFGDIGDRQPLEPSIATLPRVSHRLACQRQRVFDFAAQIHIHGGLQQRRLNTRLCVIDQDDRNGHAGTAAQRDGPFAERQRAVRLLQQVQRHRDRIEGPYQLDRVARALGQSESRLRLQHRVRLTDRRQQLRQAACGAGLTRLVSPRLPERPRRPREPYSLLVLRRHAAAIRQAIPRRRQQRLVRIAKRLIVRRQRDPVGARRETRAREGQREAQTVGRLHHLRSESGAHRLWEEDGNSGAASGLRQSSSIARL